MKSKIISQHLRPEGVWTVYANGAERLEPYKVDETTGEKYVELFPNE